MKKYLVRFFVFLSIFIVLMVVTLVENDPMESKPNLNSSPPSGDGRIVMFGDSITFRTDWKILLDRKNVLNRGIDGNTTADMLKRLDSIIDLKPRYCFLMGGINDISLGFSPNRIFDNFVRIIKKLNKSGIRPVIQSTLLVAGGIPGSEDVNAQVRMLNQNLKRFAEKTELLFIDLNQAMSNAHGLISEYSVDGVHLSRKGYEAWSRILIPFIQKIED